MPRKFCFSSAHCHVLQAATGEYIVFLDDDNIAMPHMVTTLVTAVTVTLSDIVKCLLDEFTSPNAPTPHTRPVSRWVIVGGPLSSAALFANVLGDTSMIVQREVFMRLGGFTSVPGVVMWLGCDDVRVRVRIRFM